jgi:hypothetical protein
VNISIRTASKFYVKRRALAVFLALITIPLAMGQPSPESMTGVEGVITVGPIVPGPVREGVASSAPLANFTFAIANEKGVVTSFTTDAQGRFRVSLAPGHYTISASRKIGMHGCGPFDVDVVAGKMTIAEWECDTGMR